MAASLPPLTDLLSSTNHLLERFLSVLSSDSASSVQSSTAEQPPPDLLAVLKDASTLLKAHTTKVGLLLLNKPFTPSAVAKVLSELTGTCLPAMMGAVELLNTSVKWGVCVEKEVRSTVRQVIVAVTELCKDIERVSSSPDQTVNGTNNQRKQSDSTLASTGQIWSVCDSLISLAALGPTGIVCQKVEEYRSLLRDAIDELQEWRDDEDEDEGFDDGEVSDQDSDVHFGPSRIPSSRPELKVQVEDSLKKLRLLEVGYKAISKRRLKTFPFDEDRQHNDNVKRLDDAIACLKKVPEEVDELAGKFYELDGGGAEKQLRRCCETAVKAADAIKSGWRKSDEEADKIFAEWAGKWEHLVLQ